MIGELTIIKPGGTTVLEYGALLPSYDFWMWNGGSLQTRAFDLNGRQTSYPYTSTGTVNIAYDLADRITGGKTYGYIVVKRPELTSLSPLR